VRDVGKLCESLGHRVEEASLPGDHSAMQAAARLVMGASVVGNVDAELERQGRALADGDIEAATLDIYRAASEAAASYMRAVQVLHAYGRAAASLFETYDVMLLATLGRPAIPIG
jgi:Asp-tRNA(Asn)/Glu-tRNA(Gln) amidotransferase A subunit family amidase